MTDTQFASLVNQHPAHQQLTTCLDIVQDALDDLKAKNITVLDVADIYPPPSRGCRPGRDESEASRI